MNWKYNKLADDSKNPRYDATNRDPRPETGREGLKRTKTNQKPLKGNKSNDDEYLDQDENYTVKDLKNNGSNKGKQNDDDFGNKNKNDNYDDDYGNGDGNGNYNDNDNVFDSPYDENGYAKKKGQSNVADDDPLQAIKRRLKNQFNSKIKTSTLKQQ